MMIVFLFQMTVDGKVLTGAELLNMKALSLIDADVPSNLGTPLQPLSPDEEVAEDADD